MEGNLQHLKNVTSSLLIVHMNQSFRIKSKINWNFQLYYENFARFLLLKKSKVSELLNFHPNSLVNE